MTREGTILSSEFEHIVGHGFNLIDDDRAACIEALSPPILDLLQRGMPLGTIISSLAVLSVTVVDLQRANWVRPTSLTMTIAHLND
jgi:hypothetical protein